ncbi:helix-turn-helix transcriptional regulator [Solwaraspora sp. WMMD1047]|uniref:helix-turn-helix domain-containing protein n=1 Tax=Solwaraspora sp. WMMD1047 TaxID=3016102 RepID=UPI002417F5AB|nr:helix-turn-helix transcriptional regulator [Solwaraspora sp. WMMD1047]MDG4831875.1 helix-turn-helix transcriptional regulator [Solwaraspora sp. WMMD1047]
MNEFRQALRRERMAKGLSQDALGAEVHVSGSQIGNYESGKSIPPDEVAAGFDAFFSTGDQFRRLVRQARGEAVAPWLRPWKENEERATILRTYQPLVVPGLLQTAAYARAVVAAGAHSSVQIEEMTRERLERQAATLDRPDPVTLAAIIGEAVLRDGDPATIKEQLEHLVDIGHRPNVHIRVVPFGSGIHAGHGGPFALATLPDGSSVAYVDDPLEGKVIAAARDLRRLASAWESINARALPCDLSRFLILRVIDEHEERAKMA